MGKTRTRTSAGVPKTNGRTSSTRKTANLNNLTYLTPARGGGRGADVGGRFNAKTRRLTLPARFNGRRVAVVVDGGVVVVGVHPDADKNAFAVHPTQHFLTLPSDVVDGWTTSTLKPSDANVDALTDVVAYATPTAGA